MAIAFDNAQGSQGVFTDNLTFAMTVGAGANRLLLGTVSYSLVPGMVVNAPTYNGDVMTSLHTLIIAGNGVRVTTWGLVAPDSGNNNINVTTDDAGDVLDCNFASYDGCAQALPTNMTVDITGSNPSTTTLVTAVDNSWTALFGIGGQTPGTNSTQRGTTHAQGGCYYDSNGPITPPGSFGMTISGASACGLLMVEIEPFGAAPLPSAFRMFSVF